MMDRRFVRKNYFLGIASGTFAHLSRSLIHPSLVLAAFIYEQSGSTILVGLLATINSVGLFLPQLYMSSLIEHQKRKKPYYVILALFRAAALILMILMIWLSNMNRAAIVIFLFGFFAYRLVQGSASIPFWDIIGQTITPVRLGGFIAYRGLFGGILSMLAGFMVVQPIVSFLPSPWNYGLLAVLAFFITMLSVGLFFLAHERENKSPPPPRNFWKTIVGSAHFLTDSANYRKLFLIRLMHRLNILSLAFFIPYAVEKLGVFGLSGIFLGVIQGARLFSSLIWGNVSKQRGNRLLLVWAGLFFCLSPICAFLSSLLPAAFHWLPPGAAEELNLPILVFLLALFFFSWGQQAHMIGYRAFLIESAPPERIPSYIAFINTATLPMALIAPIVGAALEKNTERFDLFFILLSLVGLLTFFTALGIREIRQPTDAEA